MIMETKALKICLTCSMGGHLTQMLLLESFYQKYPHYFVTFPRGENNMMPVMERVFYVIDPGHNPIKLLINLFQSISIFFREKPDLVISTGAGVSIVTCCLAKLFGKKMIFIESFSRTCKPSVSGKLLYPIADLFVIQWPELGKYYPRAKYGGHIF